MDTVHCEKHGIDFYTSCPECVLPKPARDAPPMPKCKPSKDARVPVAWMTADGRVATASTKECMPRASREMFVIPLYDR